jgi:hypothetical protein
LYKVAVTLWKVYLFISQHYDRLNGIWVRALPWANAPRPSNKPFVPHILILGYRSPVPLPKFQMAPILSFLIYSGSKKKEPRCACLSDSTTIDKEDIPQSTTKQNSSEAPPATTAFRGNNRAGKKACEIGEELKTDFCKKELVKKEMD